MAQQTAVAQPDTDSSDARDAWYKALAVLAAIAAFGLITMFLLVRIMPSEVEVVIERAGTTVTIVGGLGFFLVLFRMFFGAWKMSVSVLAALCLVMVASLPVLQDHAPPSSSSAEEQVTSGEAEATDPETNSGQTQGQRPDRNVPPPAGVPDDAQTPLMSQVGQPLTLEGTLGPVHSAYAASLTIRRPPGHTTLVLTPALAERAPSLYPGDVVRLEGTPVPCDERFYALAGGTARCDDVYLLAHDIQLVSRGE